MQVAFPAWLAHLDEVSPKALFDRLDVVMRWIGILALQELAAAEILDPEYDAQLVRRLRSPTIGGWRSIAQTANRQLVHRERVPLLPFFGEPSFSERLERATQALLEARNKDAHGGDAGLGGRLPQLASEMTSLVELIRPAIDGALSADENGRCVLETPRGRLVVSPLVQLLDAGESGSQRVFLFSRMHGGRIELFAPELKARRLIDADSPLYRDFLEQHPSLRARAADVDAWLAERTQLFVGREEQLAQVDQFLHKNRRGVVLIAGPLGIGKSAFVAQLARRLELHAHFAVPEYEETRSVEAALRTLAVSIDRLAVARGRTKWRGLLLALVRERAEKGQRVVLAIDGLDHLGESFDRLPLGRESPDGVFWILSHRSVPPSLVGIASHHPLLTLEVGALERRELVRLFELRFPAESCDARVAQLLWEKTHGYPQHLELVAQEVARKLAEGKTFAQAVEEAPSALERYYEEVIGELAREDAIEARARRRITRVLRDLVAGGSLAQGAAEAKLQTVGRQGRELGSRILQTMALAERPLTREELEAIHGVESAQVAEIIHRCRNLTHISADGTVNLISHHFSEYLLERSRGNIGEAERLLLEYCGRWREGLDYPVQFCVRRSISWRDAVDLVSAPELLEKRLPRADAARIYSEDYHQLLEGSESVGWEQVVKLSTAGFLVRALPAVVDRRAAVELHRAVSARDWDAALEALSAPAEPLLRARWSLTAALAASTCEGTGAVVARMSAIAISHFPALAAKPISGDDVLALRLLLEKGYLHLVRPVAELIAARSTHSASSGSRSLQPHELLPAIAAALDHRANSVEERGRAALDVTIRWIDAVSGDAYAPIIVFHLVSLSVLSKTMRSTPDLLRRIALFLRDVSTRVTEREVRFVDGKTVDHLHDEDLKGLLVHQLALAVHRGLDEQRGAAPSELAEILWAIPLEGPTETANLVGRIAKVCLARRCLPDRVSADDWRTLLDQIIADDFFPLRCALEQLAASGMAAPVEISRLRAAALDECFSTGRADYRRLAELVSTSSPPEQIWLGAEIVRRLQATSSSDGHGRMAIVRAAMRGPGLHAFAELLAGRLEMSAGRKHDVLSLLLLCAEVAVRTGRALEYRVPEFTNEDWRHARPDFVSASMPFGEIGLPKIREPRIHAPVEYYLHLAWIYARAPRGSTGWTFFERAIGDVERSHDPQLALAVHLELAELWTLAGDPTRAGAEREHVARASVERPRLDGSTDERLSFMLKRSAARMVAAGRHAAAAEALLLAHQAEIELPGAVPAALVAPALVPEAHAGERSLWTRMWRAVAGARKPPTLVAIEETLAAQLDALPAPERAQQLAALIEVLGGTAPPQLVERLRATVDAAGGAAALGEDLRPLYFAARVTPQALVTLEGDDLDEERWMPFLEPYQIGRTAGMIIARAIHFGTDPARISSWVSELYLDLSPLAISNMIRRLDSTPRLGEDFWETTTDALLNASRAGDTETGPALGNVLLILGQRNTPGSRRLIVRILEWAIDAVPRMALPAGMGFMVPGALGGFRAGRYFTSQTSLFQHTLLRMPALIAEFPAEELDRMELLYRLASAARHVASSARLSISQHLAVADALCRIGLERRGVQHLKKTQNDWLMSVASCAEHEAFEITEMLARACFKHDLRAEAAALLDRLGHDVGRARGMLRVLGLSRVARVCDELGRSAEARTTLEALLSEWKLLPVQEQPDWFPDPLTELIARPIAVDWRRALFDWAVENRHQRVLEAMATSLAAEDFAFSMEIYRNVDHVRDLPEKVIDAAAGSPARYAALLSPSYGERRSMELLARRIAGEPEALPFLAEGARRLLRCLHLLAAR